MAETFRLRIYNKLPRSSSSIIYPQLDLLYHPLDASQNFLGRLPWRHLWPRSSESVVGWFEVEAMQRFCRGRGWWLTLQLHLLYPENCMSTWQENISKGTFPSCNFQFFSRDTCWWFRNPATQPLEVGRSSHYLQGFLHPNGGFSRRIFSSGPLRTWPRMPSPTLRSRRQRSRRRRGCHQHRPWRCRRCRALPNGIWNDVRRSWRLGRCWKKMEDNLLAHLRWSPYSQTAPLSLVGFYM